MRRGWGPVLWTLGFLLQVSGLLGLVPIGFALIEGDITSVAAFSFSALVFIGTGFLLTSLFRQGPLGFREACTLLALSYISFGLIGSIPYLFYIDVVFPERGPIDALISSIFESFSGYTTTGITGIDAISRMPKTLILYRSLSQWLGGVNIIFLATLFVFGSSPSMKILGELIGVEGLRPSSKQNFLSIFKLYLMFTLIFSGLLFATGIDPFTALNLSFTGMSTGGFLPFDMSGKGIGIPTYLVLVALMIVGATNFSAYEWVFGRRNRPIYLTEMKYMLGMAIMGVLVLSALGLGGFDTIFDTISAITTTGYQLSDPSTMGEAGVLLMAVLMLIGGSTFSSAGGIKLYRLALISHGVVWMVRRSAMPSSAVIHLKVGGRDVREDELLFSFFLLFTGILTVLVCSMIFVIYGYPFVDSLFENVSAFSTTGMSTGMATSLQPELKLLMAFEMLLGRIETLPILVILRALIESMRRLRIP